MKSLALVSAVKKGREWEKALAAMPPPPANVHRPPCAALCVYSADPGQDRPKVSPTRTDGYSESCAGENFGARCYVRAEPKPCGSFVQALPGHPGPTGGGGEGRKSSLPLPPESSTEVPAVQEGEAAAKRAVQLEKEKQLQVNWR
eukprot:CAMPEP_0194348064 /NCGR_PEP_ID=MMETSP0171-20130528/106332_1 /TAXON_ID=218684 /ORGANISM="Corethron pennatum, Strain L29A3" /LENGTH=144 /DNA_ID=CAMNT_0039115375 /DNA_START=429 /DNA_END=862 /DNA_ORIENTATION=-